MKLFGREPAAWVGLIEAGLALLVALSIVNVTNEQTALIMAAVVAVFGVVTAYLTKDTMLGVLVGLTKAVIALAVGFGANLSPELTATIIAFVTVFISFFQRTQTSPAPTPGFGLAASSEGGFIAVPFVIAAAVGLIAATSNSDVWLVIAAIVGGAGGVVGAVTKDWACALVGLGVVLVCLGLLL